MKVARFIGNALENYLQEIRDKDKLLKHLNYNDKRLEFDKLFYSIIGLIDNSVPFGSQDKVIRQKRYT